MNDFKIHPKYTLWKDSHYANIYKHNDDLLKELPKYDEDAIQYSSIVECTITKFLNVSSHFTECYTIYKNPTHLYIYQRYKGTSLYEWMKETSLKDRMTHIPIIFKQLLEICIFLENHGLQHIDLKPPNILYDGHHVTLIDYNCISILRLIRNKSIWTSGVGTWKYAAPEIIKNDTVHSNSIVWSLGMILCYLFNDLPHTKRYYDIEFKTDNRKFWKKFYKYVQFSEENRYAFKKSYQTIPDIWKALLYCMLRWDPDDRISLTKTLDYINTLFHVYPTRLPYYACQVIPYKPSLNTRLYYLTKLYRYIEFNPYRFCLTVFLWDSLTPYIVPNEEVLSFVSCYMLSALIYNEYIDASEIFVKIMNVSYEEIEPYLWNITQRLQWNLYQKSIDLYIYEKLKTIPWREFIEFYSDYKERYTTESISRAFIETHDIKNRT